MRSKTLNEYPNGDITAENLSKIFSRVDAEEFQTQPQEAHYKSHQLFIIGLGDINKLFPSLMVEETSTNPEDYIKKWLRRYYNAHSKRPSLSHANPKGSAADPALNIMVKESENYSDKQLDVAIKNHNLFMAAENIQGNLLEEYISLKTENLGWVWAEGETLRACDFVRKNKMGIPQYIQIKNRDNTENSSSSAVRKGTQIQKWNRLTTRKKHKQPYPVFNWNKLNTLMHVPSNSLMSEDDYEKFLSKVIKNNPNLIKS